MPIVIVNMFEGRSINQKKQLVKDITRAFNNIDVPSQSVHIILNENPKHNCANNGRLFSEEMPG